jgi:protein-S-isoprenylcysteine O-methyltransferase Ste14
MFVGLEGMIVRRRQWSSVILTLAALAIVYGLGTTFFTVELERLVERTVTPHILGSNSIEAMNREIYSGGVERFMASNHVRAIGFGCIALVVGLTLLGLITDKRGLATFGSVGFILSIYAYFVLHMSFLAGLGMLTSLWRPFWGDLVKLGDIAYLPYMGLVYPFSLVGIDIRRIVAEMFSTMGLLVFILGVLTWFYARIKKEGIADFWIYRFSRHPQYLGWIVWSYGLMLRASQRTDLVLQSSNPGASLPWVTATLIIMCVALSEELHMRCRKHRDYAQYLGRVPFMLPLPRVLRTVIAAPVALLLRKEDPENGWDIAVVFAIYLALIMLLSLPFVLLGWPPGGGWMEWPF